MKITKKQMEVIKDCVKKKTTILELSARLNKTIAQTSRIIAFGYKNNPAFAKAVDSLNWPVSIDHGHIYLGSFSTAKNLKLDKETGELKETGGSLVSGERSEQLKRGDYVLVGESLPREHCMIYKPEKVEETLYHLCWLTINNKKEKTAYNLASNLIVWYKNRGFTDDHPTILKLEQKLKDIRQRKELGKPVNLKRVNTEGFWLSNDDISRGMLDRLKEKYNCHYKINTRKTRVVYKPGLFLGTPKRRELKAVN